MVHPPLGGLLGDLLVLTQADCLARFLAAVRDGRSGYFDKAKAIVESVRSKAGDAAAERAKREIWNYVRSEKKA
jgi:hypothetical protein